MGLRRGRDSLAVFGPMAVALAVCIYQLTLPNALLGVHGYNGLGYDDGVYFGAAVRLVHGAMPYKDFVLLHPPGVPLLLLPIALLSRLTGTLAGLAMVRLLTDAVVVANVFLVGKAVRHRGIAATWFASILMACYPLAADADHSLILEPFLVLFCLLGVIAMFPAGRLASPRRLMWAGAFFGLATTMKIWGVLVVVVALLVCVPRWDRMVKPLAIGAAAGFAIPCLPFFAAAPYGFVHQIIGDQLSRTMPGAAPISVDGRLIQLSGLGGLHVLHAGPGLALLLAVFFVAVVAFALGQAGTSLTRFELFLVGVVIASSAVMFRSRDMYQHYAYFPATFYVLLFSTSLVRIRDRVARRPRFAWLALPALPAAFAVVVAGLVVPEQVSYARTLLAGAFDPREVIDTFIPKGACVVSDQVSDALVANRFAADGACPDVVDPYGTWVATDEAHLPPYTGPVPPSFELKWRNWLTEADFLVEVAQNSDVMPWPPDQVAWFDAHFTLTYHQPGLVIYSNKHVP